MDQIFAAVTNTCPRRNFACLQEVAKEFNNKYSKRRIQNADAYAMDKDFKNTLKSSLHYYNINQRRLSEHQQVDALKAKVEDMKTTLGRNLELLLERETKFDRLLDKSEETKRHSLVFKKRSLQAKKDAQLRYYRMSCLVVLMVFASAYLLMAAGCGITLQNCFNKKM